jgi:hypothetical protein
MQSELREMVGKASPRVDACLSAEVEEQRQQCAERRSHISRKEVEVQRERVREVRDNARQASPRLSRRSLGLSEAAQQRRTAAKEHLQAARSRDAKNFAAFDQELQHLRKSTDAKIDSSLSPRSQELRQSWESINERRRIARSSTMHQQAKQLRTILAKVVPVVDDQMIYMRCSSPGRSDSGLSSRGASAGPSRDSPARQKLKSGKQKVDHEAVQDKGISNGMQAAHAQRIWDAVECAMSSLTDDVEREKVITQAESQLDLLAEHCDLAMTLYRRVEELDPILAEVDSEICETEEGKGDVPPDLVAFRARLAEDKASCIRNAAEAEALARECEERTVAALSVRSPGVVSADVVQSSEPEKVQSDMIASKSSLLYPSPVTSSAEEESHAAQFPQLKPPSLGMPPATVHQLPECEQTSFVQQELKSSSHWSVPTTGGESSGGSFVTIGPDNFR